MEDQGIEESRAVSVCQDIEILGIPASAAEEIDYSSHLKDRRRSWYVCIAAFIIQVLIVGVLHVFGVFFVALIDEFKCTRAEAAWIGSVGYGLTMFLGPIASYLIGRFGNRTVAIMGSIICSISLVLSSFMTSIPALYGSFGVLYGIGTCFAYTPTMTIASDYFDKYLTVATGIMVAGSSTGTLLLSPITQVLIMNVGWRNTLRVYAGMVLVGVWSGWMFKPLKTLPSSPSKPIKRSMARSIMADVQLWKNRVFLVWSLAITCAMFGYYVPYVHLVSHAADLGIPPEKGSVLLMLLGGMTAIGRIAFGKIVQLGFLNQLHMHQLSMVITGTACMMLPLITKFYGLVLYVILVGLVDGCFVVLLPVLTTSLFGAENKVTAWGFLIFVSSITFTLGPPVAGWCYDAYGSYNIAFHVAGVPIVTGAIVLLFIPWAQKTYTSTNVMKAARRSYCAGNGDGHGDDKDEEGVNVPLNLFAITSNESNDRSDEAMLPAAPSQSLSSSVIDGKNSDNKPYLVVDVTDVVRQKVEEAVEMYHSQSVNVIPIHEGPLSHLGSPAFVIGSSQLSVNSPVPHGSVKSPVTIRLAMDPISIGSTSSRPQPFSAPRYIHADGGPLGNAATSASERGSIHDLRRRMHALSPSSLPRVVNANIPNNSSTGFVGSHRSSLHRLPNQQPRKRLLSDSVTQTEEIEEFPVGCRGVCSHTNQSDHVNSLMKIFLDDVPQTRPSENAGLLDAPASSPRPPPNPALKPVGSPQSSVVSSRVESPVDSFVHVKATSSTDVTPVNTPRKNEEPIFQMSDLSLAEIKDHQRDHFK